MATQVYGCSDDLIEFEGDLRGEVDCYGEGNGVLIAFSDGTILNVTFGKGGQGIWAVFALRTGDLFNRIDHCTDPDAERYSDTAWFKDGKLKAWVGKEFEVVK